MLYKINNILNSFFKEFLQRFPFHSRSVQSDGVHIPSQAITHILQRFHDWLNHPTCHVHWDPSNQVLFDIWDLFDVPVIRKLHLQWSSLDSFIIFWRSETPRSHHSWNTELGSLGWQNVWALSRHDWCLLQCLQYGKPYWDGKWQCETVTKAPSTPAYKGACLVHPRVTIAQTAPAPAPAPE